MDAPTWEQIQRDEIEHLFTYHPPTPEQLPVFETLRNSAKQFAHTINEFCPSGREKEAAIQKVREAVMIANAGIACARSQGEPTALVK